MYLSATTRIIVGGELGRTARKRDDIVGGLRGFEVEGANEGMGRGWKRLTKFAVVSSAGEKGRLELTPSYFRMEEFAGVFLLFVSGLAYPTTERNRRPVAFFVAFVTNNPWHASAREISGKKLYGLLRLSIFFAVHARCSSYVTLIAIDE